MVSFALFLTHTHSWLIVCVCEFRALPLENVPCRSFGALTRWRRAQKGSLIGLSSVSRALLSHQILCWRRPKAQTKPRKRTTIRHSALLVLFRRVVLTLSALLFSSWLGRAPSQLMGRPFFATRLPCCCAIFTILFLAWYTLCVCVYVSIPGVSFNEPLPGYMVVARPRAIDTRARYLLVCRRLWRDFLCVCFVLVPFLPLLQPKKLWPRARELWVGEHHTSIRGGLGWVRNRGTKFSATMWANRDRGATNFNRNGPTRWQIGWLVARAGGCSFSYLVTAFVRCVCLCVCLYVYCLDWKCSFAQRSSKTLTSWQRGTAVQRHYNLLRIPTVLRHFLSTTRREKNICFPIDVHLLIFLLSILIDIRHDWNVGGWHTLVNFNLPWMHSPGGRNLDID